MNNFERIIKRLRRVTPSLSFALLASVYILSGWVMGAFLSPYFQAVAWGSFLAYGVTTVVQLIRGTIVFFRQLNPDRPGANWIGGTVAAVMCVFSIFEVWHMVSTETMAGVVGITLGGLMCAGFIIEILILREVDHYTDREIISSQERMNDVIKFYRDREQFKVFMDKINGFDDGSNKMIVSAKGQLKSPTPTPSQAIPNFENQKIPVDNLPTPEWAFDFHEPTEEKNKERLEDYYKRLHEEEIKRNKEALTNRPISLNGLGK